MARNRSQCLPGREGGFYWRGRGGLDLTQGFAVGIRHHLHSVIACLPELQESTRHTY